MTTTLEEIHRDPEILDRAISQRVPLRIFSGGEIAATLVPHGVPSMEEARLQMKARFAAPDWEFAMGAPMTRDERNDRG